MAKTEIPEKVWIQWYGEGDPTEPLDPMTDEAVTWCVDKINEHDVAYVTEESAVLAQRAAYLKGFGEAGMAIVKELQRQDHPDVVRALKGE